jgi:hypothetical protein
MFFYITLLVRIRKLLEKLVDVNKVDHITFCRRITANEVKYLRSQLTADGLIDASVHYFEDFKVAKYRKSQKNKLLQKLLDEIERQGVDDILAEVNLDEEDIVLSEDEDEEELRRPPGDPLSNYVAHEKCLICMRDGGEADLIFFNFECGHKYCDSCINDLFLNKFTVPCCYCRKPMNLNEKRRVFPSDFVVRPSQGASARPEPRILSQDERRQENVLMMAARRAGLEEEHEEQSDTELERVIAEEEEVLFAQLGKLIFI